MDFSNLSPHIRFINIFNYYPKEPEFVLGYDYRIFYITDGSLFLNFKDSEHLLEKNSLVMIPPIAQILVHCVYKAFTATHTDNAKFTKQIISHKTKRSRICFFNDIPRKGHTLLYHKLRYLGRSSFIFFLFNCDKI